MHCELQVVIKQIAEIRHAMHEVYKVVRAADCNTLHADVAVPDEEPDEENLWVAARVGRAKNVAAVLDRKGGDGTVPVAVNDLSPWDGLPALYYAAKYGHLPVVAELLARSADHTLLNTYSGASPLFMASLNGHSGVVHALVEAGADLNVARKADGKTALIASVAALHVEIAELLIAGNADVNVVTTNDAKMSALVVAASTGNPKILALLIAAKADIHHQSSKGTALEVAIHNGHEEATAILRSAME